MKRFRFTILALCLLLLFLGVSDLLTLWRNPQPQPVDLETLITQGPPADWLTVTGGVLDLTEAINMSGSIEIDAFLIPLKRSREEVLPQVIVETRDPQIVDTLTTWYFKLDSEAAQARYLAEHPELFYLRRPVTGMLAGGLVATRNRDNLVTLARELGMQLPEEVLFLTEAREPVRWRGYLFTAVALVGIVQLLRTWGPRRDATG